MTHNCVRGITSETEIAIYLTNQPNMTELQAQSELFVPKYPNYMHLIMTLKLLMLHQIATQIEQHE